MKKLKLNKETLIALQDKQLKAAYGGDVAATYSYTTCPECMPAGPVETGEATEESLEGEGASCCRKTCRR